MEKKGWQTNPEIVEYQMGYVNYLVHAHAALARKLKQLDPDVCIQRSAGDLTGFVGTYCRLGNCRFVYHSASNWDVNPQIALWLSASPITLIYYSLGLVLADVIVAQTHDIANLFAKKFMGKKPVGIVPQVYDARPISPVRRKTKFALWIARLIWYKRPDVFLKLARASPECEFVMAGSGPLQGYVEEHAKSIPNLRFLGQVNHITAEELCGKAQLFVNTSMIEGFPNTLLECAARETPYVTLEYDPDEVICKNQIGLHSRSFNKLKEDVEHLMTDDSLRSELGRNGRKYVLEKHSPGQTVEAYERVLSKLAIKHQTRITIRGGRVS